MSVHGFQAQVLHRRNTETTSVATTDTNTKSVELTSSATKTQDVAKLTRSGFSLFSKKVTADEEIAELKGRFIRIDNSQEKKQLELNDSVKKQIEKAMKVHVFVGMPFYDFRSSTDTQQVISPDELTLGTSPTVRTDVEKARAKAEEKVKKILETQSAKLQQIQDNHDKVRTFVRGEIKKIETEVEAYNQEQAEKAEKAASALATREIADQERTAAAARQPKTVVGTRSTANSVANQSTTAPVAGSSKKSTASVAGKSTASVDSSEVALSDDQKNIAQLNEVLKQVKFFVDASKADGKEFQETRALAEQLVSSLKKKTAAASSSLTRKLSIGVAATVAVLGTAALITDFRGSRAIAQNSLRFVGRNGQSAALSAFGVGLGAVSFIGRGFQYGANSALGVAQGTINFSGRCAQGVIKAPIALFGSLSSILGQGSVTSKAPSLSSIVPTVTSLVGKVAVLKGN